MAITNVYINLREKSRYIHEITKGSGRELSAKEATDCEQRATAMVSGALGKVYPVGNIPQLIKDIADRYASHMAWRFLHSGQTKKDADFSEKIKMEADELIKKIKKKEIGVMFDDCSFDPEYPGPSENVENNAEAEELDIIT